MNHMVESNTACTRKTENSPKRIRESGRQQSVSRDVGWNADLSCPNHWAHTSTYSRVIQLMDFWTHILCNKAANISVNEWKSYLYAVKRNYYWEHIWTEQHNAADKSVIFLSGVSFHAYRCLSLQPIIYLEIVCVERIWKICSQFSCSQSHYT